MPPLHHVPGAAFARTLIENLRGWWVFADGGVIGSNPSPVGGTWAYRLLQEGQIRCEDCGFIPPKYGPVSNNLSEIVAVVRGLETARHYRASQVSIASDSLVTLRRLSYPRAAWNGVPTPVREWALAVLREVEVVEAVLLDGHPTRAQLEAGVGKSGRPVSVHNVECDRACNLVAAQFKGRQGEK